MISADDHKYMARAIRLAKSGRFSTSPNPRVGCVIVQGDEVVGQGYHKKAGDPHAEINALAHAAEAGHSVEGATVYVTLEPCSHHGKTPPCAEALVAAKVSRVVYAMADPNPIVAGNGLKILESAGIETDGPLMEEEARRVNPGFVKRMESGLPRVYAKVATSFDGRTAMRSGESQWITGPAARADVQRIRARSCAIITGVGTVEYDDPALTVRDPALKLADAHQRQPLRVVVDSQLRSDPEAKIFAQEGKTLVVHAVSDAEKEAKLQAAGAETVCLAGENEKVDLPALLTLLAKRECNEVMVESGAKLLGAMIQNQLVDEMYVYMAPVMLGSDARPLVDLPLEKMDEKIPLNIVEQRQVGDDIRWLVHLNGNK